MIRVVHVINQAKEGGGLEHALALISELRDDFEFFVATSGPEHMLDRIEHSGARVIPIEFMGFRLKPFPAIRLALMVKRLKADVVHLHGTRAAFFGIPARMFLNVRSIYTVHILSYHKQRAEQGMAGFPYVWAEKMCCRVHDRVIAISQFYRNEILKRSICSKDKLVMIPNGVSYHKLRPVDRGEARKKLGLDPQRLWAGVAARLVPQKGIEFLIEAAQILKERGLDIGVAIAGDGELKKKLEAMVDARNLRDTVVFCGYQFDIAPFLSALDVFVLPSLWEGLPIALLEAMAMGLVCVATDIDGVKEVIEHGRTGLLVPARNSTAIADAVQSVLGEQEKFRPIGERAKEEVKKYSWADSARRIADIYRELARR